MVKPWIEMIDLFSVLADTADQYAGLPSNRRISLVKDCESSEVIADAETGGARGEPPSGPCLQVFVPRLNGYAQDLARARSACLAGLERRERNPARRER